MGRGQQRPQEMSEVLRGVRQADDRAVVVAFLCTRRRRREQIGEDCGLQGEKTTVDTERGLASNEDNVPVFNPELVAPFETNPCVFGSIFARYRGPCTLGRSWVLGHRYGNEEPCVAVGGSVNNGRR